MAPDQSLPTATTQLCPEPEVLGVHGHSQTDTDTDGHSGSEAAGPDKTAAWDPHILGRGGSGRCLHWESHLAEIKGPPLCSVG